MLLLWLSIVSMIPFDMRRLDGSSTSTLPITQRIISVGKEHLNVTDKSRDAAGYMLSKFLTRPDVKKEHLPVFIDWSLVTIKQTDGAVLIIFSLFFYCLKLFTLVTV